MENCVNAIGAFIYNPQCLTFNIKYRKRRGLMSPLIHRCIKADLADQANLIFRLENKVRNKLCKRRSVRRIPIVINNYNRLDCLIKQIAWLEIAGLTNIHIIDNASTYPPLLSYYGKSKYHVYRLDRNVGHEALWRTHVFQRFERDYYVYTDPDVVPVDECPANILEYFLSLFSQFPEYTKIGIGLKIDDIPDYYARKEEVIDWESQYWRTELATGVYVANTDTTFALYRPGISFQQFGKTLRTGYPYVARHLPWYESSDAPSEEECFFRQNTTKFSSWYMDANYKPGRSA